MFLQDPFERSECSVCIVFTFTFDIQVVGLFSTLHFL